MNEVELLFVGLFIQKISNLPGVFATSGRLTDNDSRLTDMERCTLIMTIYIKAI